MESYDTYVNSWEDVSDQLAEKEALERKARKLYMQVRRIEAPAVIMRLAKDMMIATTCRPWDAVAARNSLEELKNALRRAHISFYE